MTTTTQASSTVTRVIGRGRERYDRAQDRVQRLEALNHPGVCTPRHVDMDDQERVVATLPALDGIDLDALVRTRGPLSAGESVTIGLEVAAALEALHRAGLTHGDISAANIMLVDGSVVLVDVWGDVMADDMGTAAYAASERGREGPTPAGDVHALGMVLRDTVSEAGADRLEAWTAPMVADDPQARPSIAMVARALPSCAEPVGVDVPLVGVAAEFRARAQGPASRTERLDSGRPWRVWRAALRAATWTAVAAGAAVMVVMASGLVQRAAPLVTGQDEVPARHVRALQEHAVAAAGLTHARFDALADGDGEALRATTLPGSPAAERAEAEALALSEGEVEFSGLAVVVDSAETVATRDHEATVFVEYTVSAHQIRDGDRLFTYESYSQRVEMSLTRDADQWQVRQVRLREPPTGPLT